MSFNFFLKACNFWSKNLPTCETCTSREIPVSNVESASSRKSSAFFDINPLQSKQTPPTQLNTNTVSPTSSRQEDLSFKAPNFKFSGSQKGRVWSEEEDKLLINSVKKHEGKNWKSIAKCVPGRTATQCSQRWRRIQPYKSRQPWTKDEDKMILALVDKHGQNWSLIASMIEGRTGKQVRERFLNKLDKNINRSKFTEEDDEQIISLYEKFGPKWKEISHFFNGRPENMIKNRFYSHIRKKLLLNPKKYQYILNSINTEPEPELFTSNNSTVFPQDPQVYLFDEKLEESGIPLENMNIHKNNDGHNLLFDHEMQIEPSGHENMMLENCFDFNHHSNHNSNHYLNFNYELAPLTPTYHNNQEIMLNFIEQPTKNDELYNESQNELIMNPSPNKLLGTKVKQEFDDYFNHCNFQPRILSRGGSDENTKKAFNLKQIELLNKKQEMLEFLTKEVKEKIKNSQNIV